MGLFQAFNISASGMTAERFRTDIIAQNIANVNTTSTKEGTPYRRKIVTFSEKNVTPFSQIYSSSKKAAVGNGVKVSSVTSDYSTDFIKEYDPSNPDADADGYVSYPNVNTVTEMTNLILPCTIDMDFYEVRYDDKAESELEFCKKMYKNHAINSKNMNTVKSVILDISGGGIRFSLSTPLEEGTYFMAQFSLALEECTQQFNIVCKVINCTQSLDYADRYFARSKFIFDRMTEREKIVRFVFEEERRIRRREME